MTDPTPKPSILDQYLNSNGAQRRPRDGRGQSDELSRDIYAVQREAEILREKMAKIEALEGEERDKREAELVATQQRLAELQQEIIRFNLWAIEQRRDDRTRGRGGYGY
jgi:hypothetical protein